MSKMAGWKETCVLRPDMSDMNDARKVFGCADDVGSNASGSPPRMFGEITSDIHASSIVSKSEMTPLEVVGPAINTEIRCILSREHVHIHSESCV